MLKHSRTLTFLLLLSSFSFEGKAWATDACDCPSTDKQANSKCGPTPAKLDQDAVSNACRMGGLTLPSVSGVVDAAAKLSPAKTFKETLDYMSCYRDSKQQFCHYKSTLAPLILLASQSGNLPVSVQSCLFERESGFDRAALSPVGALGYVQFMSGTQEDVNTAIQYSVEQWNEKEANFNAKIDEFNAEYPDAKTNYQRAVIKGKINSVNSQLRVLRANREGRKAWDAYWQDTPNAPRSTTFKNVQCPNLAFIMATVKQIRDLNLIKGMPIGKGKNNSPTIGSLDETDSAIFVAGAYNFGLSRFADKCSGTTTLLACRNRFPAKHETYRHMASIENCAKKGSKPMLGTQEKNCEAYKCGI